MTVTVYSFEFVKTDGGKVRGSIAWDKYTPKKLEATLCPHITALEVDYPVWTAKAAYSRDGLETLVGKTKRKATSLGLTLISEGETRFPVR